MDKSRGGFDLGLRDTIKKKFWRKVYKGGGGLTVDKGGKEDKGKKV